LTVSRLDVSPIPLPVALGFGAGLPEDSMARMA
jgi:hypothetical protein